MRILKTLSIAFMSLLVTMGYFSCNMPADADPNTPTSASGVSKATVHVETNPDGTTVEQNNIKDRLLMDNKPGAIKYLYIISAYSGQVMISSTVKGKVTSSGKRLTPLTVAALAGEYVGSSHQGIPVEIDGKTYYTNEVLQDDGTYGNSMEYLFWKDTKGVYHQQYISGGVTVHISDQPIAVKNVTLNLDESKQ